MTRLAPLAEWPGNITLRTVLAVAVVAVLYPDADAGGFLLWAAGAAAGVNLATWWLGPRRGTGPGP